MNPVERISALKAKHQALEVAIEDQNGLTSPDEIEITALKKQKLRIKDELASLGAV